MEDLMEQLIKRFTLSSNAHLCRDCVGYYRDLYLGYREPGNPDFLNTLKNTLNNYCPSVLKSARQVVYDRVRRDIPDIMKAEGLEEAVVAVVPRSKAIMSPGQLGFRDAVQECVRILQANGYSGITDGIGCITRHTDTKTTHIHKFLPGFNNCGSDPYVGITNDTCHIDSNAVRGKTVILIDDIYTKTVNVDEDCIQALYDAGAARVVFYAVAYTYRRSSYRKGA